MQRKKPKVRDRDRENNKNKRALNSLEIHGFTQNIDRQRDCRWLFNEPILFTSNMHTHTNTHTRMNGEIRRKKCVSVIFSHRNMFACIQHVNLFIRFISSLLIIKWFVGSASWIFDSICKINSVYNFYRRALVAYASHCLFHIGDCVPCIRL